MLDFCKQATYRTTSRVKIHRANDADNDIKMTSISIQTWPDDLDEPDERSRFRCRSLASSELVALLNNLSMRLSRCPRPPVGVTAAWGSLTVATSAVCKLQYSLRTYTTEITIRCHWKCCAHDSRKLIFIIKGNCVSCYKGHHICCATLTSITTVAMDICPFQFQTHIN